MIAGTLCLEGTTLHFSLSSAAPHVARIVVQEGLEGFTSTYQCPVEAFAAALAVTLHPEGAIPGDGPDLPAHIRDRFWSLVEAAAPKALDGAGPDDDPDDVHAVRWMP